MRRICGIEVTDGWAFCVQGQHVDWEFEAFGAIFTLFFAGVTGRAAIGAR